VRSQPYPVKLARWIMNNEIYDILEASLQDLENGVDLKTILARYPKFAEELRPILKSSLQAKQMSAPAPSREAVVRGRARLMQKVAEAREGKIAPRKRVIPFFQRLAISLTVTATLLLSGTSLVGASSTALPGQNLYPVKRGWEDVRLFFTFNEEQRDSLEHKFEGERLHEVNELLSEDEHSSVDFYGTFTIRNGVDYVAEVKVIFPDGAQRPNEGEMLHVVGKTEHGYVEIISFEILQDAVTPNNPGVEMSPVAPPATNEAEPANQNEGSNQPAGEDGQSTTIRETEATPSTNINNDNKDGAKTNEDGSAETKDD